ncbi:MAG TPA: GNAT family N-acetyltransferase [Lacunisphaera sp.]|nr:GNAT family N-acetyltransferase [Lacunisphaera sp.]
MSPVVTLRAVEPTDLPVLFEQQLDPEAVRLAAFPSRERDAFMAHWAKVLANPANAARAIVHDGRVAGHIGAWTDAGTGERSVGYWIGRSFWGQGIASAAVAQFLVHETTRPLTAHVAKHNAASIRVLQKNGFVRAGEDRIPGRDDRPVEEWMFTLA